LLSVGARQQLCQYGVNAENANQLFSAIAASANTFVMNNGLALDVTGRDTVSAGRNNTMSGLLGQLAGLLGNGQGGPANTWNGILNQLLAGQGGLHGLLQQLQNAGLGEQVKSWVGTGENKPVTGGQLGTALPHTEVQGWAHQAGLPIDQLLAGLSKLLPQAVDHATPTGHVPAPDDTPDVQAIVDRLLKP
jgi:uncharacterized protein YidB (DUF937 family)